MTARDHSKALDELRGRMMDELKIHLRFGRELFRQKRAAWYAKARKDIAEIRALDALLHSKNCQSCGRIAVLRVWPDTQHICKRCGERLWRIGPFYRWHKLPLYRREVPW